MDAIGIIVVVFVILNLLAGPMYAVNHHPELLLGLVPVLYVGGVILNCFCKWRHNFFHPAPKEYDLPLKEAFARIRDHLAEVSYHYGDKWHVDTADTRAGRIIASLRFTEEEENVEGKTKRVQRFLTLDIHLTSTDHDTVMVQMDFASKIEGLSFLACDSIISDCHQDIQSRLQPAH
jgi:hypothetical protein